jgi:hypothetical protein
MFPAGWPGVALLLLRVSVATTAVMNLCATQPYGPAWMLAGLAVLSVLLCLGLLTPVAAVLVLTAQLVRFGVSGYSSLGLAVAILNSLALALLGPGAYSVDARRFGHRLLVSNRDD